MFSKSNSGTHKQVISGIHIKTLVYGQATLMTEVRLEKGAVIPPHAHPHEQTGCIFSGKMEFFIEGNRFMAHPGDSWNVPAGIEHGATAVEETVVIEVFSPVREDYLPYYTGDYA